MPICEEGGGRGGGGELGGGGRTGRVEAECRVVSAAGEIQKRKMGVWKK